mgnify:CR=1 FL=1
MDSPNPSPKKKTPQNAEKVAKQAIEQAMQSAETTPPKKKMGRPLKYDPAIADKICEQLADGIPLREICRQDGYPAWQTIYYWMTADDALGEKGKGLSKAIAHARDIGYDALAEDCLRIADNPMLSEKITLTEDPKTGNINRSVIQFDDVNARKLQVETRLKLLAKFNPKKYGDRVQLSGDAENPLSHKVEVQFFDEVVENLQLRRKNG